MYGDLFLLFLHQKNEQIIILAVMQLNREPDYWVGRG